MKRLKDLLSEIVKTDPEKDGETNFIDKHPIVSIDPSGAYQSVLDAIAAVDKDHSKPASYHDGEDEEVYEEVDLEEGAVKDMLYNHGEAIRNAANKHHAQGIKSFKDDAEMRQVYKNDRADLHKLAKHVESGNLKKAYEHMSNLDTLVRDVVPDHSYNFITKHGSSE